MQLRHIEFVKNLSRKINTSLLSELPHLPGKLQFKGEGIQIDCALYV